MSRNQLIVQLPLSEATDFERLLHIEETLMNAFSRNNLADVDGHDIGQGHFNIFIYPKSDWSPVIERVEELLKLRGVLSEALIVKRLKSSDKYIVVWPKDFDGEFQL